MTRTAVLMALAAWLRAAAAVMPVIKTERAADWSQGTTSWKQASLADDEKDLWSKPNACDARVLHSSAPLTLLFGVSNFWSELEERRAANQKTGQPFEVHVVGAAYPFEGRSDWSLLASRRPKDVPKVRIVLVLGTPWHTDNVPRMNSKEYDESMSLFQMSLAGRHSRSFTRDRKPEAGEWRGDLMRCSKKSMQAQEDKNFTKADLCRDHGNGLEVVCIEKYYQDVAEELPSPDVVAMFSPGFPQMARRSWDEVLRKLLLAEVPIMVSDLVSSDTLDEVFKNGAKRLDVAPGDRWKVKKDSMEDGMTLLAMHAYGARRLGSFRNPFPIVNIDRQEVIAKNGVLQVFHGRQKNAKPFKMPSEEEVSMRKQFLHSVNLKQYFGDDQANAEEVSKSLLIPTSSAYERAMAQFYLPTMRDLVKRHHKHSSKVFSGSVLAKLKDLGLLPHEQKAKSKGKHKESTKLKPWTLRDWIFIIQHLHGATEYVF